MVENRSKLTYVWTYEVSSEAIEVLPFSHHKPFVFSFVCDIQHWKLDNEVKSSSGHELFRNILFGSRV